MLVEQASLLGLLGKPDWSFQVPIYQRSYTWGKPQLNAFWQDAMHAGRNVKPHFVGSVFCAPEGGYGSHSLIDGQQRMVTLILAICALAGFLEETGQTAGGFDAATLRRTYLLVGNSCKVTPTRPDRPSVENAVLGAPAPSEDRASEAVSSNLRWFENRMRDSAFDVDILWKGLEMLTVIYVEAQEGDRPQAIFEALNAKGMPLSECEERFAAIHHERDRSVNPIGMNNRVFGD